MNTNKLILYIIFLNLIISLISGMFNDLDAFSFDFLNDQIDDQEEYANQLKNEETGGFIVSSFQGFERTFGNTIRMGAKIFGILISGINPFPFIGEDFETTGEILIVTALTLLRCTLYVLVGIEIYMIHKNSKVNY